MNILGISALYHDSAACVVRDGEIVCAAQEERFTRKKHDSEFPTAAIDWCLSYARIGKAEIDLVAFYDKPFLKFERLLQTYLAFAPRGIRSFSKAIPLWIRDKIWLKERICKTLEFDRDVIFPEHHESHAASAFFPSPFYRAAFLTIDGVGEWTTTSLGKGDGNQLSIFSELHFPHSLGLLYSAFTYYLGFKVNSGEYKVMGLAPYGEPVYVQSILEHLVDLKEDGSFRLNMEYFDYCAGLTMTGSKFDTLFGGPARAAETSLTKRHMDLARSVQAVTEEVMIRMARTAHAATGESSLCLAGGVALNCVANGRLLREGPFENIWIQPAAGDAGGALGAALFAWYQYAGEPRERLADERAQFSPYLGPDFEAGETKSQLDSFGAVYERLSDEEIIERTADALVNQNVVGWFQGRMEFGPRALGNRSILGDPRSGDMQQRMNLKIKYRESFRPFAPSVPLEKVSDYFELDRESPYMLLVASVREDLLRTMTEEESKLFGIDKLNVVRSSIPAVTHVDYSARIQTVSEESNPRYYSLLNRFEEKTGCAVLVNTSFNVRAEPIVCTPADAYRCFMRTGMDILVVGNYFLVKSEQPQWSAGDDWRSEFELD